jgi:hypothetical protein
MAETMNRGQTEPPPIFRTPRQGDNAPQRCPMQKRKSYTREFKLQAVRLLEKGDK